MFHLTAGKYNMSPSIIPHFLFLHVSRVLLINEDLRSSPEWECSKQCVYVQAAASDVLTLLYCVTRECSVCRACGSSWLVQSHRFTEPAGKVDLLHLRPFDKGVILQQKEKKQMKRTNLTKVVFRKDRCHCNSFVWTFNLLHVAHLSKWIKIKSERFNLNKFWLLIQDTHHQHF